MNKWLPDRKWLASGLGGVVAWLIILIANQFGMDVPADVQAAIPGLVALILHYVVPPADQDIVKRLNNQLVAMAVADPDSALTKVPKTVPPPK